MLDFDKVAQLRVPRANGKTGVGSGFRIADRLVLTAAHVVADAAGRIDVSFPALGASATGTVLWLGDGLDGALVELSEGHSAGVMGEVRWGRLTGHQPGTPATGVGFPRALKDADAGRLPDQLDGTINPGTAFGERYDVVLSGTPPVAPAGDPSPWAGLSGAALFSGDLLLGVVALDTPAFQSGRLTAVPVRRLLDDGAFTTALASHGCGSRCESVELLDLFARDRGQLASPASLLRADAAVVAFRGRTETLAELRAWCETSHGLGGLLMAGPGGQGKTRLARQLCAELAEAGWIAGFVADDPRATAASSRLRHSRVPVLAVVDYAETRIDQVRELVRLAADPGQRVRLLLLARSSGDWWKELHRTVAKIGQFEPPLALEGLEATTAGRDAAYRDALRDFSGALGRLPGRAARDWTAVERAVDPRSLEAEAFASVLTIQLQAMIDLLAVETPDDGRAPVRPDELEDALLEHEQLYWEQTAAQHRLTRPAFQPITLRRAVAAATLCGAADEDEAMATVARVPGLADKAAEELRGVADWLAAVYPPGLGRHWGGLEPDRVGEHLVGQVTAEKPDLIAALLAGASEQQQMAALTVLSRAVSHQQHLAATLRDLVTADLAGLGALAVKTASSAADAGPVLDALRAALESATDVDQVRPVVAALPARSMTLAAFAVEVTARLVGFYRAGAQSDPSVFEPRLANVLSNLSVRLSDAGRGDECVPVSEEAVALYRRLDAAKHEHNLARALVNLSKWLFGAGRTGEALTTLEEAVAIYRRVTPSSPSTHEPNFASALANLSEHLAESERKDEALASAEDALTIRRRLAAADPAYERDLAQSLHLLSKRLAEVQRMDDALAAGHDAVNIRRRLAAADPAYEPDLAHSLNDLSLRLRRAERHDEALEAIEQAVAIRRRLATSIPAVHEPLLATSLHNLSRQLATADRHAEGLRASEEAVAIFTPLAASNPGVYEHRLATVLATSSDRLAEAGRGAEAIAAIEEALTIRRGLLDARPEGNELPLATALSSYSRQLASLGRNEEAQHAESEASGLRSAWYRGTQESGSTS